MSNGADDVNNYKFCLGRCLGKGIFGLRNYWVALKVPSLCRRQGHKMEKQRPLQFIKKMNIDQLSSM